jgi:hypothetical protein
VERRREAGEGEERHRPGERRRIGRDVLTVGPSARILSRVHSVDIKTEENRRGK